MACVVAMNAKPAVLRCTVCKGEAPLPLPLTITQTVTLIRQFQTEHALCREPHPRYADVIKHLENA